MFGDPDTDNYRHDPRREFGPVANEATDHETPTDTAFRRINAQLPKDSLPYHPF
jgi:hypothetical protein